MSVTVGFIGLGVLGLPMAERLLARGLPLVVWNRTAEKAAGLAARGAARAATPRELAAQCDVVVTTVTDGAALEDVALGADGVAAGLAAGRAHCDMSTVDPGTSARLAAHYAAQGRHFVHAPVFGSKRAAATGTLLIFAGGPADARALCRPVFEALGEKRWEWDDPRRATCTKLAVNLLLGGMMAVFCESLVFAGRAGVDVRTMLSILGASALGAPMYQAKGATIAARNFAPNFYLRNMRKDLDLILAAASALGAPTPATRAVRDAFAAAAAGPRSGQDYSAIFEWLEETQNAEL
jgi:3-hydroxyisobutyrate dehydrogenase-like beta-hydroxyacid dehydrogenase